MWLGLWLLLRYYIAVCVIISCIFSRDCRFFIFFILFFLAWFVRFFRIFFTFFIFFRILGLLFCELWFYDFSLFFSEIFLFYIFFSHGSFLLDFFFGFEKVRIIFFLSWIFLLVFGLKIFFFFLFVFPGTLLYLTRISSFSRSWSFCFFILLFLLLLFLILSLLRNRPIIIRSWSRSWSFFFLIFFVFFIFFFLFFRFFYTFCSWSRSRLLEGRSGSWFTFWLFFQRGLSFWIFYFHFFIVFYCIFDFFWSFWEVYGIILGISGKKIIIWAEFSVI